MDEERIKHYTKNTKNPASTYVLNELLKDPWRAKLDNNAIVLYLKLLSLCSLSIENGWFNEQGHCFVKMNTEKMAETLNMSKNSVVKIKQQLIDAKLIEIPDAQKAKKQRHSYPIYVNLIIGKVVSMDKPKTDNINKNKFNNIQSNDYDFDLLEKQIIEN